MKLAIGVFAYNEEKNISGFFASLKNQDVFQLKNTEMSIYIIANGCTDSTVPICEKEIKDWKRQGQFNISEINVVEIKLGDKANAWNIFIHEICTNEDYVILLDADILFANKRTLNELILVLQNNDKIEVTTSCPIKTLPDNTSKLFKRLSISSSSSNKTVYKHSICGQIYAGELSKLKKIYLPKGLPVEDGFIRANILTKSFSEDENFEKVLMCDGAAHYFEGESNIKNLIRHQVRIVVGSSLNSILFRYLKSISNRTNDACFVLKDEIEKDSDFIDKLVKGYIKTNRFFIIPKHYYFWRFDNLEYYKSVKKLIKFPIVIIGFIFDLIVALRARRIFKDNKVIYYW